MHVGTMLQQQIITATPDMTLADGQRLMRDNHIRHVPVVSGKRLVGIITDRHRWKYPVYQRAPL